MHWQGVVVHVYTLRNENGKEQLSLSGLRSLWQEEATPESARRNMAIFVCLQISI